MKKVVRYVAGLAAKSLVAFAATKALDAYKARKAGTKDA